MLKCGHIVLQACCHADDKDATPGPLDYSPDPGVTLPSAPCFTIAGRAAAVDAATAAGSSSPGPGNYAPDVLHGGCWQGPAWSMAGRAAATGGAADDSPGELQEHCTLVWVH